MAKLKGIDDAIADIRKVQIQIDKLIDMIKAFKDIEIEFNFDLLIAFKDVSDSIARAVSSLQEAHSRLADAIDILSDFT